MRSPRSFMGTRSGTRIFFGFPFIAPPGDNESSVVTPSTFSASVLEGQEHARAVGLHLSAFNLEVRLHHFGDTQIAKRASGGFHGVLGGGFPGFSARADYFSHSVNRVRLFCMFAHDVFFLSFVTVAALSLWNCFCGGLGFGPWPDESIG